MNASQILHADILDIIFENRNKAYGAYDLRKFYDRKVAKALSIVFILGSAFAFIAVNDETPVHISTQIIVDHQPGMIIKDMPPPQPKENKQVIKATKQMSGNFVFVDSLQLDSIPVDADRMMANGVVGDDISEPAFSGMQGRVGITVSSPPAASVPPEPFIDIHQPIEKPDVDPLYPGGMEALTKFLKRHLENPQQMEEGETKSVKIKFVVGYDGELKSFEVKEDGGEVFNKEVIRVLKKMPRWIPGKNNGQNVAVYFTIPVKFINGQ